MTFKVTGPGHSANHNNNYWSYRVDFDINTKVTNHGKQNVTLTFKVKSQFYNEMHQNHDILQKVCGNKMGHLILKIIGQFSSVTALKS